MSDLVPLAVAEESVLMDLRALLVEAKQKVPPVLQVLQTGDETMLDIGGEALISVFSSLNTLVILIQSFNIL